jgi:hypothetical protein
MTVTAAERRMLEEVKAKVSALRERLEKRLTVTPCACCGSKRASDLELMKFLHKVTGMETQATNLLESVALDNPAPAPKEA